MNASLLYANAPIILIGLLWYIGFFQNFQNMSDFSSQLIITHLIIFAIFFLINLRLLHTKAKNATSPYGKIDVSVQDLIVDALHSTVSTHTTTGYNKDNLTDDTSKIVSMVHQVLVFLVTTGVISLNKPRVTL